MDDVGADFLDRETEVVAQRPGDSGVGTDTIDEGQEHAETRCVCDRRDRRRLAGLFGIAHFGRLEFESIPIGLTDRMLNFIIQSMLRSPWGGSGRP